MKWRMEEACWWSAEGIKVKKKKKHFWVIDSGTVWGSLEGRKRNILLSAGEASMFLQAWMFLHGCSAKRREVRLKFEGLSWSPWLVFCLNKQDILSISLLWDISESCGRWVAFEKYIVLWNLSFLFYESDVEWTLWDTSQWKLICKKWIYGLAVWEL